jgi:ABC-type sugar transport system substrate-binding protein
MFPMSSTTSGELVAAPALDSKIDLLAAADAGGLMLTFDTRGDRFGEDRRDAFQGLSEREATELVARSVLAQWHVKATGPVTVSRAAGAPYAAAWLDGTLRINPAFVYMASAPSPLPAP